MIEVTVGDLATRLNVEYATAGAIVKLIVAAGKGKKIGKRPTSTGRGKPADIYQLEPNFCISLAA